MAEEMFEDIVKRVAYYEKLGVDPLSLATGCAVKVDLERVVYPALRDLKRKLEGLGFTIAPREDADIFSRPEDGVELHRRIYSLGESTDVDPEDVRRIKPERAIVVIQIYQRYANRPDDFARLVWPVYERLAKSGVPLHLGKGHSIVTPFEEDQFALFDFIKPLGRRGEGYVAANNDTMHIIDPTEEPGEYRQVAGAISNTLNDLFVLGVHEKLRIAPVINAPLEELKEKMMDNVRRFASELGAKVLDIEQPSRGRLLVGATVLGETLKKPPTFHDQVRPGMKLIATRPFGELAPINVYVASLIDPRVVDELGDAGITLEELEKLKNDALSRIAAPNIGAARVISKYLPNAWEDYDPTEHIAATTDVTGPGVYVIYELAQLTRAKIRLHEVPVLYPRIAEYAARSFILANATAGTNGAFVIIAPDEVAEDIVRDLKAEGYNARIIGEVVGKGNPEVEAPNDLRKYVTDQVVLSKFKLAG